ncbi:HAMP domain-containing sensor histidine kinase [Nodosilinea sp. E11]|uniref:sensor histidine kinase n=1 Tax=Nodosilinea sp. E11 TaxID=3037479 RepID=UPI00293466FD|nr:HAMP domain-containing sensor histidine kinase [Nodosilinea sp. E11]WOD40594.1 HAMP domain-containing sensor histidine kinase [Nodosilinea sp. E11]
MALPPLDYFLIAVPAYALAAPIGKIIQTLEQPETVALSHIVVIDDEHRPLGAIALGRLWVEHQSRLTTLEANAAELRLFDCQTWLEPVIDVAVSQTVEVSALAALAALAQATPTPMLVVVDADGQYLGVLNLVRLLGWLAEGAKTQGGAATTSLTPAQNTPSLAQVQGAQRAWVLELSHALKTPITTLLGLSTLLLDHRVGSLSDRQFRYVSLMRQAIRKLTSLVNLLLDWMRLESDQIHLSLERVSLQPLVDDLVPSFLNAQLEAATPSWSQRFKVCLASTQGWVMADPLRLRQSLHYGLSYLLAHGAEPGGLVIEHWGAWLGFTLWSHQCASGVALSLDTGLPSEAPLQNVFQNDPQADPWVDPQTLQGLGLSLAQRLSQLHGGEVSSLNTPTWGCRITVLLPAPIALDSSETTVLVLLACASKTVVEQVYGSLRGTDYRLIVAPCCQTLMTMQARLKPRCTLLHWESLPDAPASAAARQALEQRLGVGKPVILQSSRGGAEADRSGPEEVEPEHLDPEARTVIDGATLPVTTLLTETIAQGLRPLLDQHCQPSPLPPPPTGLTMLLLRPLGAGDVSSALPTPVQIWLQRYRCRLLQVDDLEQASLLSRVWQPHALILDRTEPASLGDLQALARYADLAHLPLVSLVTTNLENAAGALGLKLVSCPEVLNQPPAQGGMSLIQAIALLQTPAQR